MDVQGCRSHRLYARSTVVVNCVGDNALRQTGLEADHPGDVGGMSRLRDVAEDDLVDELAVDAIAGQQLLDHDRAKIVRGDISQCAAGLAERRADTIQDGDSRAAYDPAHLVTPARTLLDAGCDELPQSHVIYRLITVAPLEVCNHRTALEPASTLTGQSQGSRGDDSIFSDRHEYRRVRIRQDVASARRPVTSPSPVASLGPEPGPTVGVIPTGPPT